MKKGDHLFSKNDLIILKKLISLKNPILITKLSKKIGIAHKSVKPRIEFLEKVRLVNVEQKGKSKPISINSKNLEFSKKFIFLCKQIPLT